MKGSIISAFALASLAAAIPAHRRIVDIEIESSPDTFVQGNIAFNQKVSVVGNANLDSGIGASIATATGIDPSTISCQLFDAFDKVLATFGESLVVFSQTPVAIAAIGCTSSSSSSSPNEIATIEMEISADTFDQDKIQITGQMVDVSGNPRLNTGITVTPATTSGVSNPSSVICQAFQNGKALGGTFSFTTTATLSNDPNTPVPVSAIRCTA